MPTRQMLREMPGRLGLSLGLLLATVTAVYLFPALLQQPWLLVAFELVLFGSAIFIYKYPGALGAMKRVAWPQFFQHKAVSKGSLAEISDLSELKDYLPSYSTNSYPPAFGQVLRVAEYARIYKIAEISETSWVSSSYRFENICRAFEANLGGRAPEVRESLNSLTRDWHWFFSRYAAEVSDVRRALKRSQTDIRVMILEDEPLTGALVEETFEALGLHGKRVSLPPETEEVLRHLENVQLKKASLTFVRFDYLQRSGRLRIRPRLLPLSLVERNPSTVEYVLSPLTYTFESTFIYALGEFVGQIAKVGAAVRAARKLSEQGSAR